MAGPVVDPADGPISNGSLSVLSGGGLTLWRGSDPGGDTMTEYALQLAPDRPAVIGRSNGYEVPYLDPAYTPTTVLPGTQQAVLHSGGQGTDIRVSRGHFMLRAVAGGISLVNGVPQRGGGIRVPLNGTWLLAPERRPLGPAEEYLIESGASVVLWLPNESELRIAAQ